MGSFDFSVALIKLDFGLLIALFTIIRKNAHGFLTDCTYTFTGSFILCKSNSTSVCFNSPAERKFEAAITKGKALKWHNKKSLL